MNSAKADKVGSKRKRPSDFDNDEPAAGSAIVDDGPVASSSSVAGDANSVAASKATAASGASAVRGVSKSNRSWKPIQTKCVTRRPAACGFSTRVVAGLLNRSVVLVFAGDSPL
jgi:hypothetical protein